MTNANGEFEYQAGDSVSFYIGDVLLGSAIGSAVVTPIDLVPNGSGSRHPKVVNTVRLLQTLDDNNNPDDGIQISDNTAAAFVGISLDLEQGQANFSQDSELQHALSQAKGSMVLVNNLTAIGHFEAQLRSVIPTYSVSGTVSGLIEDVQLTLNQAETLTVSDNGQFIFDTRFIEGNNYIVTYQAEDGQESCTLLNDAGSIASSDINNVSLVCGEATVDQYSIGGSVSGLTGSIRLESSLGEVLDIDRNGDFVFTQHQLNGSVYDISLISDPVDQNCRLTGSSGTIADAIIEDIDIECETKEFSISGSVKDHTGPFVIKLGSGQLVTVDTSDTSFTFGEFSYGQGYHLSIEQDPPGQNCSISHATGLVEQPVNVQASCTNDPTYRIGGTVSGLSGAITLSNNGGDSVTLTANGSFAFGNRLLAAEEYSVLVVTPPVGENCQLSGNEGTVAASHIDSIRVSCDPKEYAVSVQVNGLVGSDLLALVINGNAFDISDSSTSITVQHGSSLSVSGSLPAKYDCEGFDRGIDSIEQAQAYTINCQLAKNELTIAVTGLEDTDTLSLSLNGEEAIVVGAAGYTQSFNYGTAIAITESTPNTKYNCSELPATIENFVSSITHTINCSLANATLEFYIESVSEFPEDGVVSVTVGETTKTMTRNDSVVFLLDDEAEYEIRIEDDQDIYSCSFADSTQSLSIDTTSSNETGIYCSKIPLADYELLDPEFQKCVRFTISAQGWTDYADVVELSCGLENHQAELNPIKNIGGIKAFTMLKELNISGHQVTDISELAYTAELTSLIMEDNPVKDLDVLGKLRKLRNWKVVDGKYINTMAADGRLSTGTSCKPTVIQNSDFVYGTVFSLDDYVMVRDFDIAKAIELGYLKTSYDNYRRRGYPSPSSEMSETHNNARCYGTCTK